MEVATKNLKITVQRRVLKIGADQKRLTVRKESVKLLRTVERVTVGNVDGQVFDGGNF